MHRIVWWLLVVVLVTGVAMSSCAQPPAPAAPIKWRAQSGLSPTSFGHTYQFKAFADMVSERSQGRLTIELFAPGAIVDAYEQFGAVQKGAIEMGAGVGGYNVKWVPESDIEQGLPGTFASEADFFDAFMNFKDGAFYKLVDEAYREKGAHLLKSYGPYPNVLIMRQPIKSVDEIKGKKIRASGGYVDLAKNLGAAPVQMAPAEIYMALQTGTIDGLLFPNYTIGTMKFWDVAKGIVIPEFGQSATGMYVNLKAYDSLPADLKKIVDEAALQASQTYINAVKQQTGDILDKATKQYGVQIIKLSDADFAKVRQAAEPILTKAAAMSPRAAKMVDLIKAYNASKKK